MSTEVPADLPPTWLRDNCPCPDCRDPHSGQKLAQITDLPTDLSMAAASVSDGVLHVQWAPDGHRSRYDLTALAGVTGPDPRTAAGKTLWPDADALADHATVFSWPDYGRDPAVRERALAAVADLGFVLLRGVPITEGAVLEVAGSFGYVRETNYGRLFDVRVVAAPDNLAFSDVRITPHTDNPYRDPVPTVQLLHCLRNEARGGETGLVDGFAAAERLREEAPEHFAALTTTSVPFTYADASTALSAHRPLIGTTPEGAVREIRFNNRSLGTLRLDAQTTERFYRAYRAFGDLLARPEVRHGVRLAPGDCLVFDNTRVLHARTAFDRGGARHLQGCYADLDALLSELVVVRRAAEVDR